MKRSDMLRVHSLQTLGTLDGPGVRFVLFLAGCPLRCRYCHNPDTWEASKGKEYRPEELCEKVLRYKEYFGGEGGVTFSGGEPLLQAKALMVLCRKLKEHDINIALDTSGCLWNEDVSELLRYVDLCILDIKHTDETKYRALTGGNLSDTVFFLERLNERGIKTWVRQVVAEGLNDSEEELEALAAIVKKYTCITKSELLGFKKLCITKYEELGVPFPMDNIPEMDAKRLEELNNKYLAYLNK